MIVARCRVNFVNYEKKFVYRDGKIERIRGITEMVFELICMCIALAACALFGALYYHTTQSPKEDWTFFYCFYYCIMTITNVGYSDFDLNSPEAEWFCLMYMAGTCILAQSCLEKIGHIFFEIHDISRHDLVRQQVLT